MDYEGPALTSEGLQRLHVRTSNGHIVLVEPSDELSDKLLVPAIADEHVHLRDLNQSDRETIHSGTNHLLRTGTLYARAMPNTNPPLDSPKQLEKYLRIIEFESFINAGVYGLLTPHSNRSELEQMSPLCDNKFKAFMAESVGSGFFTNKQEFKEQVGMLPPGAELRIHCEDPRLIREYSSKWDASNPCSHYEARPSIVEATAIQYVIDEVMPKHPDLTFIICHISSEQGVSLIREAKKGLDNLLAETCFHYLYFTKEDFHRKSYLLKCNPSIKLFSDQQALIKGVNDGVIDFINSDHAPHTHDAKWVNHYSGIPSCNGPVYGRLIKTALDPVQLIKAVTLNSHPHWDIKEGNPAKLVILDMNEQPVMTNDLWTKARSVSPWIGEELPVVNTVIDGNQIIKNQY